MSSFINNEYDDRDDVHFLLNDLFGSIDKVIRAIEKKQVIAPVDKDYLLDVKPRFRKYDDYGI